MRQGVSSELTIHAYALERMLRKAPKKITFFGPMVTYALTLMLGTGHAVYTIMPIIGDIALKNKIRPERPMTAASVASQM